jgi:hypothetical protein
MPIISPNQNQFFHPLLSFFFSCYQSSCKACYSSCKVCYSSCKACYSSCKACYSSCKACYSSCKACYSSCKACYSSCTTNGTSPLASDSSLSIVKAPEQTTDSHTPSSWADAGTSAHDEASVVQSAVGSTKVSDR